MKNNLRIISVVITSLLLILTFSCEKNDEKNGTNTPVKQPTITTAAASNITTSGATLGGNVTSDGNATVTEKGVVYSTTQNPTTSNTKVSSGSGTGAFTVNVSSLSANTTYYVRAYAINSQGTAYGTQVSFTTGQTLSLATVTTTAASNITTSGATLGGNVTSDGNATVTEKGVVYSTTQNPTTSNTKVPSGSGTGDFTVNVSSLSANTTYYVRAYAINSQGTAYGSQISFTTAQTLSLATVTTTAATNITTTGATMGGNVTSDGNATVTEKGVVYSTTQNPTTSNTKVSSGSGTGAFTVNVSNLSANTTYYVRAYAINSQGTAYGSNISFTTEAISGSTVTDIDGNVYNTVTIGTQVWMAKNLKTTKYRNGDLIGTTTPSTLNIITQSNPKYQWAYAGNESNVATYGRLYTWHAATDSRNVCPTGWHLPTDSEWTTLTTFLGGESVAGSKLKETGTTHWPSPNTAATNSSGFTALPGGYRGDNGAFSGIVQGGYWWSSTEYSTYYAWARGMFYDNSNAYRDYANKTAGFSVRCLRDN